MWFLFIIIFDKHWNEVGSGDGGGFGKEKSHLIIHWNFMALSRFVLCLFMFLVGSLVLSQILIICLVYYNWFYCFVIIKLILTNWKNCYKPLNDSSEQMFTQLRLAQRNAKYRQNRMKEKYISIQQSYQLRIHKPHWMYKFLMLFMLFFFKLNLERTKE